ncbi:hypothetical protein SMD44_00064 [Streptomyces alboflavus]|uniref:Uncharacterized protein n=1 Tax=Streptomyces alboflavus TaxID=67267 RepID=A0A1Z1W2M7_9ACTN|nr:hypothetical protein [Streptomyces alboflavus]ARX80666.1 hypothetical protein SMD44_00064 [Streptomyces alboflavus]
MDAADAVLQRPAGGLVVGEGEVAAGGLGGEAHGAQEEGVARPEVQRETEHAVLVDGAEDDARLADLLAQGVEVPADALVSAGQSVLRPMSHLEGGHRVVECFRAGGGHGVETAVLVGGDLFAQSSAAAAAEPGHVLLPVVGAQLVHGVGAEERRVVADTGGGGVHPRCLGLTHVEQRRAAATELLRDLLEEGGQGRHDRPALLRGAPMGVGHAVMVAEGGEGQGGVVAGAVLGQGCREAVPLFALVLVEEFGLGHG